jgi:S1-C subfamily serine protease
MENTLVSLSTELTEIVQKLKPCIVSVRARRHYPSSGFRWSPEIVVTADHTVQRDEDISVTLDDGETAVATLVGRDPGTDIAVLKLAASGAFESVPKRVETVKVGELILVMGRSPDSGVNASLGILSAVSGPWRTWRGGNLDGYLRLDARLFPQSSGGVVVNVRGEIIGIASSALSRIAGLAIPFSTAKRVTEKVIERGFVPRAYLGLGLQPVPLSEDIQKKFSSSNKSGLIILTVEPGSPAANAGLLIGDVVIGIADLPVEQTDDVQTYLDSAIVGTSVTLKFIRAGSLQQSVLAVGERASRR